MLPQSRKRPVTKRTPFDSGKKLQQKNSGRSHSSLPGANIKLSSVILLGLLVLFIVTTYSVITKGSSYDSILRSKISALDSTCSHYVKSQTVSTFLNVTLGEGRILDSIDLYIYDDKNSIRVDMNKFQFNIDKAGNKGSIKDYINLNNVYLDDAKLFRYMTNLFIREFLIKVDHISVGERLNSGTEYLQLQKVSRLHKPSMLNKVKNLKPLMTDLCLEDWFKFSKNFDVDFQNVQSVAFNDNFKLTDYFDFVAIKKDQLRVHLNNSTGVESWGSYFTNLLNNYGIDVVKVDYSGISVPKTTVAVGKDTQKKSATISQLNYLMDNRFREADIQTKESIFADIYITMGEDLLVR